MCVYVCVCVRARARARRVCECVRACVCMRACCVLARARTYVCSFSQQLNLDTYTIPRSREHYAISSSTIRSSEQQARNQCNDDVCP